MSEFRVASQTTVPALLEETAAEDYHSIGHSLYKLADKNIGWFSLCATLPYLGSLVRRHCFVLPSKLARRRISFHNVPWCILAGNSLGGRIAWDFTLQNPNMVDKLILIDASGHPTKSKSKPLVFRLVRIPVIHKVPTFITPRFIVKK